MLAATGTEIGNNPLTWILKGNIKLYFYVLLFFPCKAQIKYEKWEGKNKKKKIIKKDKLQLKIPCPLDQL